MTDPVTDPARHPALSGLWTLVEPGAKQPTLREIRVLLTELDVALAREPAGETRVEWGVRWSPTHEIETAHEPYFGRRVTWTEEEALAAHRRPTTAEAFSRTRTTYPDRVTDWSPVAPDAEDKTGGVG